MKLIARIFAALLAAGALAAPLAAQVAASAALLVLAKGDQTLAVVDPVSLKVLGRVPSGPDPHEVVASADGRVAYISNYNGGNNIITVVDLVAMKAMTPIDLGPLRAPHGLAFSGGKLWFTAEGAKVIGSYDPAASRVDWVLGTGQNRTHMIIVSPDLQHIATSNVGSASMTFIARSLPAGRGGRGPGLQGDWDETIVSVGPGAEGFDVSPDGKELWAANAGDGTISIIDVAARAVTRTLAADIPGANRLKFTPDGTLVLVSSLSGPELLIVNAATRATVKRLRIGRGAAGIVMAPDGRRAYVACTPDDYVAIIDLATLEVAGHIDAGRQPDGLAWAIRQ
jgi:YVTN family beta-propeller protein